MKMGPHTFSVLFLVVIAVANAAVQNVFEFNMKDALKDLDKLTDKQHRPNFSNILRKHPTWTQPQASGKASSNSGVKVGKFSWKDCSTTAPLVNIKSLSITPDPLGFPGPLNVATEFIIKQNIGGPLPTKVLMEKKILGKYRKIPCVDQIGSCSYDDLCSVLGQIGSSCPPPIKAIGIECTCPLVKGSYNLPMTTFNIDASIFPSGSYHLIGNVTSKGQTAVCLEIYIELV